MQLSDVQHFHDWCLIRYRVDCEGRRLVLQLAWYPETENARRLDVVFDGLVGHAIENAQSGNIISALDECSPRHLVEGWSGMFERLMEFGFSDTSFNFAGTEQLNALLEKRSIRAFEFHSAIGASGFVLAGCMSIVPAET